MRVRLTETCIVRMGSRFYNDNCVNYDRDRSQFLEFMPFLNIHRSDLKLLQRILAIYVQLVHILCDIRNLETRFGSIEWNNIKYISGLLFWGLHNSFTKTTFSVSRRSEKVADRRLSAWKSRLLKFNVLSPVLQNPKLMCKSGKHSNHDLVQDRPYFAWNANY